MRGKVESEQREELFVYSLWVTHRTMDCSIDHIYNVSASW
jgi:hypothetical protein